jgi:hypothetical protein
VSWLEARHHGGHASEAMRVLTDATCETKQPTVSECPACQNHGRCNQATKQCECIGNWGGESCTERDEHDDCESVDCHGGRCLDMFSHRKCIACPGSFSGEFCEIRPSPPVVPLEPCQHGGERQTRLDVSYCECPAGFTGEHCQLVEDSPKESFCNPDPCVNGGSCMNLFDRHHCICKQGWRGATCDIDAASTNAALVAAAAMQARALAHARAILAQLQAANAADAEFDAFTQPPPAGSVQSPGLAWLLAPVGVMGCCAALLAGVVWRWRDQQQSSSRRAKLLGGKGFSGGSSLQMHTVTFENSIYHGSLDLDPSAMVQGKQVAAKHAKQLATAVRPGNGRAMPGAASGLSTAAGNSGLSTAAGSNGASIYDDDDEL